MPPTLAPRFAALDWLRGLVIVLMTVDHASGALNAGRFMQDAAFFWKAGTPIPAAQFLLRWVTHLCAPTFVFLAGTSIALSAARRGRQGETERSFDLTLLKRGAFIAALDPLWMSFGFTGYSAILLQVMYALGVSMMLMVPLRKVRPRTLLVAALGFCLTSELWAGLGMWLSGWKAPSLPVALLLTGGRFALPLGRPDEAIVAYPALPWLALMVLGHAFGSYLLSEGSIERAPRVLMRWGAAFLAVFVVVRGANGYGNMRLLRDDAAALQWLHVSKYPPSLAYVTLELGLAALLLALGFVVARRGTPRWLRPLELLGQTSLFFYVLHVHVLEGSAVLAGEQGRAGIAASLGAAALTLAALLPLCARYARYKRAHPDGIARYI